MLTDIQSVTDDPVIDNSIRNSHPMSSDKQIQHFTDDTAIATHTEPGWFLALRRGSQLMAVFRDYPHPSIVLSLKNAQIMIGLALSADELAKNKNTGFAAYDYVFISSRYCTTSALTQALTDLTRNNWSIDRQT